MSLAKTINRSAGAVHRGLYRATGGAWVLGRWGKAPILLLTTTGRKSGKHRTMPLMYVPEGEGYALVASSGGSKGHPGWYHNLTANPEVEVQVGRQRRKLRARTATDEERERLWPQLAAIWPAYESYQQKTSRRIPVVVLEP